MSDEYKIFNLRYPSKTSTFCTFVVRTFSLQCTGHNFQFK